MNSAPATSRRVRRGGCGRPEDHSRSSTYRSDGPMAGQGPQRGSSAPRIPGALDRAATTRASSTTAARRPRTRSPTLAATPEPTPRWWNGSGSGNAADGVAASSIDTFRERQRMSIRGVIGHGFPEQLHVT
ncbi:hypothetical protein RHA1_ro07093 [Rhodococcus jostii RHA1]|uniref:Uncharacterized protein n=1 Tax=Rhodococcus jostii (strain RHA1) TaxID=101510 RepID=Q0S0S9_RHOJR|nr:hypothetical protein RHA1_ro07093 [Rhodococcus jostii RHA1]